MKYKVGDKVRVKSLEWYNENKSEFGDIKTINNIFVPDMSRFCGKECTICDIIEGDNKISYALIEDTLGYCWTNDMFEGLVENNELNKVQDDVQTLKTVNDVDCVKPVVFENIVFPNENYADKVELCLGDDYEIVVEDGRTFVQKKKPKYPTTYEECCRVLNVWYKEDVAYVAGYKNKLLNNFQKLLICRDAYWKIAGEEMELGKSWGPIWDYNQPNKYILINVRNSINKDCWSLESVILAFPTEEMRDAFYDNFKGLIENCKELL